MGQRNRLTPRLYYGIIIAGLLLGITICTSAGWAYLSSGDAKPTGRSIWEEMAEDFVIPICVMIGATFGGLAGVAVAAVWERSRQQG